MVFTASKMSVFSFLALGLGGIGLWQGNEKSKKTISESLGKVKLVSDNGSSSQKSWIWLLSGLDETISAKTPKFKKIVSSLQEERNKDPLDLSELSEEFKKTCESSKQETYSSLFIKNKDLMEDVKKFCSIKIKEVLSKEGLLDFSKEKFQDNQKQTFVKSLSYLQNYYLKEIKFNPEIQHLQSSLKNSVIKQDDPKPEEKEENIQYLYDWCRDSINSYYLNEGDEKFELVRNFCEKNSKIRKPIR